jgi:hypothetical protein
MTSMPKRDTGVTGTVTPETTVMNPDLNTLLAQQRRLVTTADVYAHMITLRRLATPSEVLALAGTFPDAAVNPELQRQLQTLKRVVFNRGAAAPEAYERIEETPAVTVFHGAPAADRLLLAFCGKAHMLLGPVARVLQRLPAARYDVVVVRDLSKAGYERGVPGFSHDLGTAVQRLVARHARGRAIYCLGTSGGGGAALLGARIAGAVAAVSFSGRRVTKEEVEAATASAAATVMPERKPGDRNLTALRLTAVFCAGHVGDAANARHLAVVLGAQMFAIPDSDKHNSLHVLDERGALTPLLRQIGML